MNVYEIGGKFEESLSSAHRRSTGSHYTPQWLTRQVVQLTLQPLLYPCARDGGPMIPETMISSEQILSLKVVDIACGAGAFLFTAWHYLALKLCEAWAIEQNVDASAWRIDPLVPHQVTAEREESEWLTGRLLLAQQMIAKYCIYGVDINAEAVSLMRFLLWIQCDCQPQLLVHLREAIQAEDALKDNWMWEIPDVVDAGGFDAVIGNPPFMGGMKITGNLGVPYRDDLVKRIAGGKKGSADLSAYFLLRAGGILKSGGTLGLVTTDSIAQGATCKVGLAQLVESRGFTIYHATKSMPWPGSAAVRIAIIHAYKGVWRGLKWLG